MARTTHEGNQHVVCPTFEEVEGQRAFLEVVRLHDLIDAFEAHGLSWGIIGDDVPQPSTLEDIIGIRSVADDPDETTRDVLLTLEVEPEARELLHDVVRERVLEHIASS